MVVAEVVNALANSAVEIETKSVLVLRDSKLAEIRDGRANEPTY